MKKVRCHNRKIHKCKVLKKGVRKRNQAAYMVKGFRLFDRVDAKGEEWYIHSKRTDGSFVLKRLDGSRLEIAPSKIHYVSQQHGFITESHPLSAGYKETLGDRIERRF